MLGLAAGYVNALSTGGGMLAIPGLIFLGLPPVPAIATSRLSQLASGVSSSVRYQRGGAINWRYMPYFVLLAVSAGAIGPHIVLNLDPEFVEKGVAILLLILLPLLFLRKDFGEVKQRRTRASKIIGLGLMFLTLLYSTMFGAGSGIFFLYILIGCFGMKVVEANATCAVPALIGTVVALITYISNDMVSFHLGVPLMAGALAGGYFGAQMALRRGSAWVKWLLAVVIVISSAKLLIG